MCFVQTPERGSENGKGVALDFVFVVPGSIPIHTKKVGLDIVRGSPSFPGK